ncbi:putative acyl-CoA ligase [Mycolicibacter terrae]|jgi:fatty-acyl-CoA synthase|uniref:Acyl-CoA ligase n=1 Tax=Mycolicibacter terrae TaxID=1788 RepID=A0AAD1HX00_9MYCO|nr:acyl-CoA synthetase [Mycolicibacter terrae]ORW92480.1 acyl-CoA synthetase [Mycolicibacter terrae]BBX23107.1 putative acyl-CoA ligase [Mycolicibacter terrae]SNV67698.1 fatty-acid--CoA ligase [Mycolicibacter terrae]
MYPGAHAATTPDKPAIVVAETGETVTYGQLDTRSLRFARHLYDVGVRPGDHIAVLSDNQPRALEIYWAALRSGLYVTFVNSQLTAAEVAYIVNDCDAQAFVIAERYAGIAATVIAQTPRVGHRIALGGAGCVDGFDDYETLVAAASTQPLPAQPCGADMLYSSGTTGFPKGIEAPLPGYDVDESGDRITGLFAPVLGLGPDSVYLSPAPVYHAAPLRFMAMAHRIGATVVMMRHFDAADALLFIERYRVTHSQWVPTMFVRMLRLDRQIRDSFDLSSHRCAVHGAAPCPVEVKRAMIDWWGPILLEYYSATEAAGTTIIDSQDWLRHPGSVGKPVLGIAHICDDSGAEVATGETGTVYFERDVAPFEYHNDPQRTAETRHRSHPNWTTTGDVGRLDAEGYLYLTDRKSFTIISGGVNIYPQEIENALALHPAVLDVAVIGVPDPEMGQSVVAVVHPTVDPGRCHDLPALLDRFLRERIASYKVPRRYEFSTDLPRTPTGKLIKGRLQERYA